MEKYWVMQQFRQLCALMASAWLGLTVVSCQTPRAYKRVCPTSAGPANKRASTAPNVTTPGGLGAINLDLLSHVALRLVDKIKIGVGEDGAVDELSIYHNDPAPIPAPVKALLAEKFPNPHVVAYETEWEDKVGAITEVEFNSQNGRFCELSATNAGEPLFVECRVDASELPKHILAAVAEILPGAQIQTAAAHEDASGNQFVIQASVGTLLHVLHLSPDGQQRKHQIRMPAILLIDSPVAGKIDPSPASSSPPP